MALDMDLARKSGQMAQNMKESGDLTKPMAKENSGMQMVMYMKVSGKTTRLMALVCMFMSTVLSTKAIGVTTCKTVLALNPGQMGQNMKVATKKE